MRKTIVATTAVGMALLSACSSSSSTTRATFATIPASDAPTGAPMSETTFTGTGTKTEPSVTLKGSKGWIYIACVSQEENKALSDAKNGGVEVSVNGTDMGGAGCGDDHDKSSPLITIKFPLKGSMSGPMKIETAKDTRWQVTLASGW